MKPDFSKLLTKEFLEQHYVINGKTSKQIGKEFNFKAPTVEFYIKKHKLKRPKKLPQEIRADITKELLHNELIINKLTIVEIARKYNIHRKTIRFRLKKYNLIKPSLSDNFNKESLEKMYLEEDRSLQNIADLYHVSRKFITNLFIKFNIEIKKTKYSVKWNKLTTDIDIIGYKEIHGAFWRGIKSTAKSRKWDFEIDIAYVWDLFLKQDRKCTLSGIQLSFGKNADDNINRTCSLDRIDSSKGYVTGNVQWVHKDINKMKLNLPEDKFLFYIKSIYENKQL